MGLLASWEDFENGGLYDRYRRYPFFATRADYLATRYAGTFLIVGCGWGYLVDELLIRGIDAWGVDWSDYAIRTGRRELPHMQHRIIRGDARRHKDLQVGPGHFDVAVSEDMLTVMVSPGEMLRVHNSMKQVASSLVHIVSYEQPDKVGLGDERIRWHTMDWWGDQFGDAHIVGAQDLPVRSS